MTPIPSPTETRPIPLEPTTPIKPSEAIRLGCLIAPVQAFDDYEDRSGKVCAIGAMNLGLGRAPDWEPPWWEPELSASDSVQRLCLDDLTGGCPADCELNDDLGAVAHLNDDHRWSRERIADWLQSLGL